MVAGYNLGDPPPLHELPLGAQRCGPNLESCLVRKRQSSQTPVLIVLLGCLGLSGDPSFHESFQRK